MTASNWLRIYDFSNIYVLINTRTYLLSGISLFVAFSGSIHLNGGHYNVYRNTYNVIKARPMPFVANRASMRKPQLEECMVDLHLYLVPKMGKQKRNVNEVQKSENERLRNNNKLKMSNPRMKVNYLKSPKSLKMSPRAQQKRKRTFNIPLNLKPTDFGIRSRSLQNPFLKAVIRRLEGRMVYRRLVTAMN